MQLGGAYRTEADKVYKHIIEKFQDHPAADVVVVARNRFANENLHAATDGNIRMDAVFYMQSALDEFATLNRDQAGKIITEIALLGQPTALRSARTRGGIHRRQVSAGSWVLVTRGASERGAGTRKASARVPRYHAPGSLHRAVVRNGPGEYSLPPEDAVPGWHDRRGI